MTNGMPAHNPLYINSAFGVEMNLIKFEIEVVNSQAIKDIVPWPLEYTSNTIHLIGNRANILKGNIHPDFFEDNWKEVAVQIPVLFKGEKFNYLSDAFANNPGIIALEREIYGQPRLFANIEHNEDLSGNISVKASNFNRNKNICSLKFNPVRKGEMEDLDERRGIVFLKQLPSAIVEEEPAIKQLITMNYIKMQMLDFVIGDGTVELSDYAPEYIKDAGIKKIKKIAYSKLEFEIYGGKIIYDYKKDKI